MAGKVKALIDLIVAHRTRGNPTMAGMVRAKLLLRGINPDHYTESTPDDPIVMRQLEGLARDLGVDPTLPPPTYSLRPPPPGGRSH
jgi:hypothetical protein